jgi:hypothetical protein
LSGRVIQSASAVRRPVEVFVGVILGGAGSTMERKPGSISCSPLRVLSSLVRRRFRARIRGHEGFGQRLRLQVIELLQFLLERLVFRLGFVGP